MSSESSVEFLRCFVFVHGCSQLVDDDVDFHKALSQVDFPSLSKINALKDFGNNLFRQHQFDFAGDCYDKACRLLCSALNDKIDHDLQSSTTLAVSLSLNLAACANKLYAFEGALTVCSMVLNFFPRNAKALFRSAVALRGLNRFSEAKCALEAASLIEPHNKDIIGELEEVKKSLCFNQNAQRVIVDCLDTSDVQQGEKLVSDVQQGEKLGSDVQQGDKLVSSSHIVDVMPNSSADDTSCTSVKSESSTDVASSSDTMVLDSTGCISNEVYCNSEINVDKAPCSKQEQGDGLFTFNKCGRGHSNLRIDANSYKNLLEGKTIYVHQQNILTTMSVRVHNLPQKQTLTGTLLEEFSREAVVPSSGPLAEKLNKISSLEISENVELVNKEAVFHINKKKRLTFDSYSVSKVSTTQFEFTAVKEHLSKKCSCKVEQTNRRGHMTWSTGYLKKRSLVSVELLSSFCRYTTTVAEGKGNKRKGAHMIQFDNLYHPPVKKRRLSCSSCSFYSFNEVSWVSSSLGPSGAPVFIL